MKYITFYNLISRLVFTTIDLYNPSTVVIALVCKLFLLFCLSRRILLGSITIHESCSLIIPTSTKTADAIAAAERSDTPHLSHSRANNGSGFRILELVFGKHISDSCGNIVGSVSSLVGSSECSNIAKSEASSSEL